MAYPPRIRDFHKVTVKPLICEGGPFGVSKKSVQEITRAEYIKSCHFEKYFEMRMDGDLHYETYSWQRNAELYRCGEAYFAVVYDALIYHVDDPNGHRDFCKTIRKSEKAVFCGDVLPEALLFDFELTFY